MNYFEWFLKKGWKAYSIPFAIIILIDIGLLTESISFKDMPLLVKIMAVTAILGANIGFPYHSIGNWKKNKEKL